jgi:hypothetical protein
MRLRYFAADGTYDVEAPDGTQVAFRSHVQVGAESFLDDLLMVPWQDRVAPIPGEIVPVLARTGMYGLRLLNSPQPYAGPSRLASPGARVARPCRAHGDLGPVPDDDFRID